MEGVMDGSKSFRIQPEAMKALAEWKALFAEHVSIHAKQLAQDDQSPGVITVDHYCRAAKLVLPTLAPLIQIEDPHGGEKAA